MCEAAPEQPPPLRLLQLLLPPPRPLQHDRRRRTPYRCRNHNRVGTDSASLFLAALDRKHHHTTCRAVQPMPLAPSQWMPRRASSERHQPAHCFQALAPHRSFARRGSVSIRAALTAASPPCSLHDSKPLISSLSESPLSETALPTSLHESASEGSLSSSATLPVPSIGRESSARGRNIMMEKRTTRSILALRGCGFRGLDYLLLRASLIF